MAKKTLTLDERKATQEQLIVLYKALVGADQLNKTEPMTPSGFRLFLLTKTHPNDRFWLGRSSVARWLKGTVVPNAKCCEVLQRTLARQPIYHVRGR